MQHALTICCALTALLTSACSMATAVLHESTPVQVAATPPPAPEPEPEPPARVQVEADAIRVTEKIQFEFNSADISSASDSLLREIAQVMVDNAFVRKVRVEGHTDNQGAPRYNLDLSRRRANAVMERLVQNGVEAGRLESEGYGLTRPLGTNETDEGRAANRRVEFNILEQDTRMVDAPEEGDSADAEQAPAPSVTTGGQAGGAQ